MANSPHQLNVIKVFALLLAVIGLVLIVFGLVLRHEHPAMLGLVVLGAVLTYQAFSLDKRREQAANEAHDQAVKRRVEALERAPWDEGYFLEVKKSDLSALLFVSLILVAGTVFAFSSLAGATPRWGMFAGSALFLLFMAFVLFRLLPGVGKPALVMNRHGFRTPLHGMVPWYEVGGISLQKITIQSRTTNTLTFQVESLAGEARALHWTERVLGAFGLGVGKRKVVPLILSGASEAPETVYAVARRLWHQQTGMNHEWSPMWSKEANQAARRTHEFIGRYKNPNASTEDIVGDPDAALTDVQQFRRDVDTLKEEQRRAKARSSWLLAIGILGMVASLLWPVVKRYFS